LVLAKIIKIVATRRQILRLKYTKFDVGWGSAPDPAGGAYSAHPDPLAGFKGPTSKERGQEGRGEGREGRQGREGREGKRREGSGGDGRDGKGSRHPQIFTWIVAYGKNSAKYSLTHTV